MKKLVTGTEVRKEEHPINLEYKDKLSDEVLNKSLEFSTFYFSLPKGFDDIANERHLLKHKSDELKTLVADNPKNQETFISYLEDLILGNSNYEFLIPYYDICNEAHHSLDSRISVHLNHHFGLLGTVNDILTA